MKEIKIFLKGGKETIIYDDNELDNIEYAKRLHGVLFSEKIDIIEFTDGIFSGRPSEIVAFTLRDKDDTIDVIPKNAFK